MNHHFTKEGFIMKKRSKRTIAIVMACAAMASTLPVSAASSTFYGYTINYSKSKLSNARAQAVTSCTGATSVTATCSVVYNLNTASRTKSATNSGRVAVTATVDVGTGGYITSVSGTHRATVTSQGISRSWTGYS